MRFWLREIAGWAFVLMGLGLFWLCLAYLRDRLIFSAGIVAIVGIIVFRAGIHVLKVAVAARLFLHSRRQEREGARSSISSR